MAYQSLHFKQIGEVRVELSGRDLSSRREAAADRQQTAALSWVVLREQEHVAVKAALQGGIRFRGKGTLDKHSFI